MVDFSSKIVAALLALTCSAMVNAQEVRYSWFEIGFVQQSVDKVGVSFDPVIQQAVLVATTDGGGTKFRGSVGTWNNLFLFMDFNSTDVRVNAVVSNPQGDFPAQDEFDFTTARGGVGVKWSLTPRTDIYGAVSYDSTDLDFGSFAGEDFDAGSSDLGAEIGVRSMFGKKLELRAAARYTSVGDVDLNTGVFDADTLFGVGFGFELIRGLSLTGDFESGQFQSWNIGFRLDLDED